MMNRWIKSAYSGLEEGKLAEDKKCIVCFAYRPGKLDRAFD